MYIYIYNMSNVKYSMRLLVVYISQTSLLSKQNQLSVWVKLFPGQIPTTSDYPTTLQ